MLLLFLSYFFFFNDTATTEIYTLSLHDALPSFCRERRHATRRDVDLLAGNPGGPHGGDARSARRNRGSARGHPVPAGGPRWQLHRRPRARVYARPPQFFVDRLLLPGAVRHVGRGQAARLGRAAGVSGDGRRRNAAAHTGPG